MNLLDLMVRVGVNDEASNKLEGITEGAIARASAMGHAMYDAVKYVAGNTLEAVKSITEGVIEGYGNYEQLIGGVQKLYGNAGKNLQDYADSVGKTMEEVREQYERNAQAEALVEQNAKNAWRTAQMSANEYMETATTFSSKLIADLDGDTVAAAEMTDKAMRVIADNYNTYGGNIENIQDAIKGLARGNTRMLDNLKLGYQEGDKELQRLIDDANKYAEDTGKTAGLTKDSFADIIQAIEYIQEKNQIAGTTEAEALKTIEGSMNAAKASWENFLTAIGSGDMSEIQKATDSIIVALFGTWDDDLNQKSGGLVNNLIPVLENVGTTLIQRIPSIGEKIGFQIVQSIMQAMGFDNVEIDDFILDLEDKLDSAKETITNVFTEVSTAVSGFFSSLTGTVDTGYLNVLFDTLKETLSNIWSFIEANILPHLPELGELMGNVANFVMDFANSFLNLYNAVSPAIPIIVGALAAVKGFMLLQTIIGFVTGIGSAIAGIIPIVTSIGTIISTFGGVLGTVAALVGGLPILIAAVVGAIVAFIATNEDARAAIAAAWETIKAKGEELLEWFSTLPAKISAFFDGVGELLTEAGRNIISGLLNGLKEKFEDVKSWVGGIGSWIASHKGPKQYDLGLLVQNGEWIMAGLQEGLQKGLPPVEDTLSDITDSIQTGINANANVSVAQAPSTDAAILSTLNMILNAIPDGVYLDKRTLVGNLAPSMNVAMGRL